MGYTADLCTGGSAAADSIVNSTYSEDRAFDDSGTMTYDHVWGSADGFPHWIGYAFSSVQTIRKVRLYQYYTDSKVSDCVVEASNDSDTDWDDKSWTTLESATGLTHGSWQEITFSNETAYQYVRLRATSGTGTRWLVSEIEMMAYEAESGIGSDGIAVSDTSEAELKNRKAQDGLVVADTPEADLTDRKAQDGLVLADASDADLDRREAQDGLVLSGAADASTVFDGPAADGLVLSGAADASTVFDGPAADGLVLGDTVDAFNWTSWLQANAHRAVRRFYFTLTGTADGTTDVEIPIESFQARHRNGDPTYLSVVIPGVDYADEINDRPNSQMIVELSYLLDGVESIREEILRVDLEEIYIDEGPVRGSITLTGRRTATWTGKIAAVSDIYYQRIENGVYRLRAAPDPYLKPGDTVRIDGVDTFTAGMVTYIVGPGDQRIEIEEAA